MPIPDGIGLVGFDVLSYSRLMMVQPGCAPVNNAAAMALSIIYRIYWMSVWSAWSDPDPQVTIQAAASDALE